MSREFTRPDTNVAWHAMASEQAPKHLAADASTGMGSDEIARRLATYGPNSLPATPRRGLWLRLLLQFHNPLIYGLLAAGVVTIGLNDFVGAGVIAAVMLINALKGFIQEGKAEKALDAVRAMLASGVFSRPHWALRHGPRFWGWADSSFWRLKQNKWCCGA